MSLNYQIHGKMSVLNTLTKLNANNMTLCIGISVDLFEELLNLNGGSVVGLNSKTD